VVVGADPERPQPLVRLRERVLEVEDADPDGGAGRLEQAGAGSGGNCERKREQALADTGIADQEREVTVREPPRPQPVNLGHRPCENLPEVEWRERRRRLVVVEQLLSGPERGACEGRVDAAVHAGGDDRAQLRHDPALP
jgi:hypothetical protein